MVEEGELGLDEGKHLTMTMETLVSLNDTNMQYHHTPPGHYAANSLKHSVEKKRKGKGLVLLYIILFYLFISKNIYTCNIQQGAPQHTF